MTAQSNIADFFRPIDSLANNLRRLMAEQNICEAELARQAYIPQPTLHKVLTGKTADPRASTLKSLADFFDTTIDMLMFEGKQTQSIEHSNIQSIAVLDWRDCLHSTQKLRGLTPSNWDHWIVTEYISTHAFALTSKPSMEPKFPKGSILIIDPETDPEDGDIVVVYFKDTDAATLRELSVDGPIKELSTVCKSPIINAPFDENVEILGVVVKSVFTFE